MDCVAGAAAAGVGTACRKHERRDIFRLFERYIRAEPFARRGVMSALAPKADIREVRTHVR